MTSEMKAAPLGEQARQGERGVGTSEPDHRLEPLPPELPGGYGRSSYVVGGQTPRLVRGDGAHVVDETGHRLIDANNNFAVLVLGHGNAAVVDAVRRSVDDGLCFGLANTAEPLLAEALVDRIGHAEQVRFTNSGTEAVMTALRAARAATGRAKVVGIANSYHGSSEQALAIRYGPSVRGVSPAAAGDVRAVPLNDIAALHRVFDEVGDDVAAVVLDLLPNYAGLVQVSPEFAVAARSLCTRTGAYLIFDEIISFRAEAGGLQARYPVRPDLTTLGKAIGGGLPIGAVAGSRAAMDPLSPFGERAVESSGTFTGNPVSTAAGLACLTEFDAVQVRRISALGDRLRTALRDRVGESWTVRGTASLVRILPAVTSPDVSRALWWETYRRGTLMMPTGLMALSTPMDEDLVDRMAEQVSQAAAAVDAAALVSVQA